MHVELTIAQIQLLRRYLVNYPMDSAEYSIFNMLTNRILDGPS